MQTTLHHAHSLGAAEAKRRIFAGLQRLDSEHGHVQEVGHSYDAASKTFTLNVMAYGRPAKAVFVFGDSDVSVAVDDDAGWFIDHFFVEPKIQAMLGEALTT